jgi:hypothetical protein
MDLELIGTLAFYQTKNLVIADSQTYIRRYLGLPLSFCFSPGQRYQITIYSKYLKMEDISRLSVHYLLTMIYNVLVHQQLNLHVYIKSSEVASDTDETSNGAISLEKKHGCTLIKLYVFLNYFYSNKMDIKWCYSAAMNKHQLNFNLNGAPSQGSQPPWHANDRFPDVRKRVSLIGGCQGKPIWLKYC